MADKQELRFDNRVAIVTGAGGGLGKIYALLLASRGAKVVVNDLGTSHKGEGNSAKAADLVVEEIKAAGGQAVANYDSVEHGDKIVKSAIDAFGRIDIVINNAGILRDVSFVKMKQEDWDLIYKVHLFGAYSVSKAAWNYMREQNYGRIIMTASAAGLFGNFGQTNYSAMKLALLGLANTLALEGASKNIKVNTIAPVAGTRMTATVMPPELLEALKPEYVAPLVTYLCHENTDVTGGAFELGAGWVSQIRFERTQGQFFNVSKGFTPEMIRDNWERITDFTDATHPASTQESLSTIVAGLNKAKEAAQTGLGTAKVSGTKKGNEAIPDPDALLGTKFPSSTYTVTPKDVALYALATGAARADPIDPVQLNFVYENSQDFAALPTMGAIFGFGSMAALLSTPGISFNPMMLLHGEQYLEIRSPIPTSATLTTTAHIKNLYDKGKNGVVTIAAETRDEQGKDVVYNEYTVFIRGIGGFGGDRGPSGDVNVPPNRAPDVVHKEKTSFNEALIYRLASGDMNPLHADPSMAAIGGLEKPILHGLCSFAYASRAVLHHFCNNDTTKFKSVRVRFSKHVFPGETIVTEMWKVSPTTIVVRAKVEERDEVCLSSAAVEIVGESASASTSAPASSGPEFKSAPVFQGLTQLLDQGGAALVKQVNGIYHFVIAGPGGSTRSWGVDLKSGPSGKVIDGKPDNAGVTLKLSDDDLVDLFAGDLDAQNLFMEGKLQIAGDMGLALRLSAVVKAKARL
eukprot:TRINITY_DN4056_c0_g1_i1.p1 TRINITY_DN4056_c0_g1~~TRINITY_DN4056_c0_g1_i1.p1  ORF type:complete len:746 (-),score=133.46 TRINITY_DN4056_c0_g1_i1:84-2321(-)